MTTYSQQDKKRFRTIGHQLRPVITIGNKGLTEQVMQELERALTDHELIKIKIIGDREEREEISAQILDQTGATCIQSVGGMVLIIRPTASQNPTYPTLSDTVESKPLRFSRVTGFARLPGA